jgi:uncharacterized protein
VDDGKWWFWLHESRPLPRSILNTMTIIILLLGLVGGMLVGLLGIGGGVVLVPAMVYLLHMDQHTAQGTSLFVLLPPIGWGALREYWKQGQVDLKAGVLCALGMLIGAYAGSFIALPMPLRNLRGLFGCFLILVSLLLWKQTRFKSSATPAEEDPPMVDGMARSLGILAIACLCGVASGMFGIGGGVLLVPLLVLLFAFSQHRAQGTSLIALIPPTGILALLAYAKAGFVSWKVGLLLIPGLFFGGFAGGKTATWIKPRRMRQVFAAMLFALGAWQAFGAWRR